MTQTKCLKLPPEQESNKNWISICITLYHDYYFHPFPAPARNIRCKGAQVCIDYLFLFIYLFLLKIHHQCNQQTYS